MRNDYQYIDPDFIYTDPETGVLRNLGGITDSGALSFVETAATAKRTRELKAMSINVADSNALFAIHHHLFQDVYEWAGKRRTVEISKGGKQFFPLSRFDSAFKFIDSLLAEYGRINNDDKVALSNKLAEILDAVNYLHPFREGNGRTQREFLVLLARAKGWTLNLNPPDNADIYERYMAGTISGEVKVLGKLIFECLGENANKEKSMD
ncbi:MAG: Fic family protein [Planctomycetota bacterium]|jgi:cell filamentation protein|nr:Fic family protein [Planctomycetota bacterium]